MAMDLLVWTIARDQRLAEVCEDGSVSGDPELVADLEARLHEAVTVYRRGTTRPRGEGRPEPFAMRPGDGRYVVARVRSLCDGDSPYVILDCTWRAQE